MLYYSEQMSWMHLIHTHGLYHFLFFLFFYWIDFQLLSKKFQNMTFIFQPKKKVIYFEKSSIKVMIYLFPPWVKIPSNSHKSEWINSSNLEFLTTLLWGLFVILAWLQVSHFSKSFVNLGINYKLLMILTYLQFI